jgi:hypothetical protein
MSPYRNFHYLERRLVLHFLTNEDNDENELRRKFVYQYLKGDGTFMLRLVANNVSDYVCRKIIIELYHVFYQSLKTNTIGREPLFKSISERKSDDNDNEQNESIKQNFDDDGSTDQTIAADIPPVPNPRHGKVFFEQDGFPKLTSDITDIGQNESQQADSSSISTSINSGKIRVRSCLIPLLKDIHRASEIQIESSDTASPHYKNVEFLLEPDTTILSTAPIYPPPLPPPTTKGPSPYATTYLTKKRPDHELPYIDDSISTGSLSGRLISTTVVPQSEKPKTTLASTNIFFRRSHDV